MICSRSVETSPMTFSPHPSYPSPPLPKNVKDTLNPLSFLWSSSTENVKGLLLIELPSEGCGL